MDGSIDAGTGEDTLSSPSSLSASSVPSSGICVGANDARSEAITELPADGVGHGSDSVQDRDTAVVVEHAQEGAVGVTGGEGGVHGGVAEMGGAGAAGAAAEAVAGEAAAGVEAEAVAGAEAGAREAEAAVEATAAAQAEAAAAAAAEAEAEAAAMAAAAAEAELAAAEAAAEAEAAAAAAAAAAAVIPDVPLDVLEVAKECAAYEDVSGVITAVYSTR